MDGYFILGNINVVLLLDEGNEMIKHTPLKIYSSKVSAAVGSNNLKDTLVAGKDRDIECCSSQIEYEDVLNFHIFIDAVGNSSCGGFVDQPQHIQSCHFGSVLYGLPLQIIEVRRHSNYGLRDILVGEDLCHLFELHQYHR
jgi:hypothetical protein